MTAILLLLAFATAWPDGPSRLDQARAILRASKARDNTRDGKKVIRILTADRRDEDLSRDELIALATACNWADQRERQLRAADLILRKDAGDEEARDWKANALYNLAYGTTTAEPRRKEEMAFYDDCARAGPAKDYWLLRKAVALCQGSVQPRIGPRGMVERDAIIDKDSYTKRHADIVVYGGSASGVIASVAAAREGKSVLLLEPGKHLGGMVSGGLGATDVGNRHAIGGYSLEFFQRVKKHYEKKYGPASQQVRDCADGFRFEPHVASLVFDEMLKEMKVEVQFERRLKGIHFEAATIRYIIAGPDKAPGAKTAPPDDEYFAKVYVDASYEGDLMALARVRYAVGREGKDVYGESIAGVQEHSPAHQWPVKLSPFLDAKKLLPLIQPEPAGSPGAGDRKVQAYNFRLCLTQDPKLRLPWPKPKSYDPARFELVARYLKRKADVKFGQLCNPVKVPNGKTDTNNNGPISTDHIGANWDYPEAPHAVRRKIWDDHVDYTKGLFYFLATDKRVPKKLQDEVNSWGHSKGEFEDTDNWPHQLYVREARRMLGAYVMTQADIMDKRTKDDSVGLGSYNTDSHHVQRVVGPDDAVLNEGDFQVGVKPYAIPYRSLTPKEEECKNLLVPLCMSASHVAYGTVRMEPVYMILGQASGVAASQAVDAKTAVQKIDVDKLRTKLKEQKAVLSPDEIPISKKATGIDPKKLGGIVVDDTQATRTGAWTHSTSTPGFVGEGYLHDNNKGQGKKKVRFTPKIQVKGMYEVRILYPAFANRASNALVVIHHAGGGGMIRVNQKTMPKGGFSLGVMPFDVGEEGWVEIRNDGADGFVVADAVQWIATTK
ncbi:MAG: FAD-dependent oxidoreductase [Gemmataceae bacterium]